MANNLHMRIYGADDINFHYANDKKDFDVKKKKQVTHQHHRQKVNSMIENPSLCRSFEIFYFVYSIPGVELNLR